MDEPGGTSKDFQMIFMLLLIVFLAHCFEEWAFGFPDWARRHFGPITTHKFYVLSHFFLFAIVLSVSIGAANDMNSIGFMFFWFASLAVMTTNGIFHVSTSIYFKEYSPGVVSSLFFTFPFSCISYLRLSADLPAHTLAWASAAGAVVSIFFVHSLTWRKIF